MTPSDPNRRPRSEGLDHLDQARAASLADEGGASAAALDSRDEPLDGVSRQGTLALFCAGAAGVVLLALACRQRS